MKPSRKHLAVVAVAASAVIGTAGIAAAANNASAHKAPVSAVARQQVASTATPRQDTGTDTDTDTDTGTDTDTDAARTDRAAEEALTGDTATKVSDAALAAVPGGTIVKVETDTDNGGAYEAHVTDASGNEVKVVLDSNFAVVDTLTGAARHGGKGDGGKGDGGQRADETPLTGDTATKVTAAAQAAVPGGTIERVETDADSDAAYEAHATDASGNRVTVTVDESYNVVETVAGGQGGRAGHVDGHVDGDGGGRHGRDEAGDTDGGAADTTATAETTTGN